MSKVTAFILLFVVVWISYNFIGKIYIMAYIPKHSQKIIKFYKAAAAATDKSVSSDFELKEFICPLCGGVALAERFTDGYRSGMCKGCGMKFIEDSTEKASPKILKERVRKLKIKLK